MRGTPARNLATYDIYRDPEGCVFGNEWQQLNLSTSAHCFKALSAEIKQIEKAVREHLSTMEDFVHLKTAPGIGDILAMTILLETGDISRFKTVGNYASYSRVVPSKYISNGKCKGKGNVKNGNKYLSWAFAEAAHHAMRYEPIRKYHDKKKRKSNGMVAIRAVSHKLARACYYILRDKVNFNMQLAFG